MVGLVFVLVVSSMAGLFPAKATDTYIYAEPDQGSFYTIDYSVSGPIDGTTVVKPLVTYTYIPISGTLTHDQGWQSSNYTPYAISVRMSSVTTGYTLTCSIISGGVTRWSGELGSGQSSPTITVNGATTYVRLLNQNSATVSYSGTITLVNN